MSDHHILRFVIVCALAASCDSSPGGAPAPGDVPATNDAGAGTDVSTRDAPATVDVVVSSDTPTTTDVVANDTPASAFTLTSPVFVQGGTLPAEYTCDGVGHSPPLAWTGAPAGTVEFALLMTTLARDGLKWNWVLYGIPATATSLAVGSMGVGTAGLTSDGPALAYSPPCSRGPGPMMYTFTLYALSGRPTLPARANQVTGAVLTDAIRGLTLASSAVTVTYTR